VPRLSRESLLAAAEAAEAEATQKRIEAAALDEHARLLREAAGNAPLHGVNIGGKVNSSMQTVHRVAISKGRAKTPFMKAVTAAGYTLRSLATRLDTPVSLLSMYRAENGRPIPRARAERIEKLTGWPANAAHWPNGIA